MRVPQDEIVNGVNNRSNQNREKNILDEYKIRGENLSKTFISEQKEKYLVFSNLNFEIRDKDFVSLIGPSGCGKTTLLYLLAGLDYPTEGRILVNGSPIKGPGPERSMVFQQDAIFLWRKVVENVEYGMEIKKICKSERRKKAMDYLRLVGLEKFANYYPKELSGGMRKRVAIAMVFANSPDILLMDEPFGSLDYPTKVTLQKELLSIWEREKRTTMFVTHDLEEALFLSTRIIVLYDKKIVENINIDYPRPREDDLRTAPEFQEMKRKLWAYLK